MKVNIRSKLIKLTQKNGCTAVLVECKLYSRRFECEYINSTYCVIEQFIIGSLPRKLAGP